MTTLEKTVHIWEERAQKDPFHSWLIVENGAAVRQALSFIQGTVLKNRITTIKSLAINALIEKYPQKTLLSDEEVLIKISEIANKSNLAHGKKLQLNFINQIIGVYNFLRIHRISIDSLITSCTNKPEKANTQKKLEDFAEIFHSFEEWCKKEGTEYVYLDRFSAEEEFLKLLEKNEYPMKNVVMYQTEPRNELETAIREKILSLAEEKIDIPREEHAADIPETLDSASVSIYETPRLEVEGVLETAASLIEDGTAPHNILILTPEINQTVRLLEESIADTYITDAGVKKALQYDSGSTGLPLAVYPAIQSVLSALSAAAREYQLTDLQTVLSAPCFAKAFTTSLTPGKLAQIAKITGVQKGKNTWMRTTLRFQPSSAGTPDEIQHDKHDTVKLRLQKAAEEIPPFIEALSELSAGSSLRARSRNLLRWLTVRGWTKTPLSPIEGKARGMFLHHLEKLSQSLVGEDTCSMSFFTSYLKQFAQTKTLSLSKNPDACIRVEKIRNAESLRAEYVFVIGLSADKIPNVTSILPPFTESETNEIYPKLKSSRIEADLDNFTFSLFTAEKRLYLSYAKTNGLKNTTPSSFLSRIEDALRKENETEEKKPATVSKNHMVWYDQIKAGNAVRNLTKGESAESVEQCVGLPDRQSLYRRAAKEMMPELYAPNFMKAEEREQFEKTYTQTFSFSPSMLETYLECPYKWYLKYHLKLFNPFEAASDKIAGGTAVHAALEDFIREFKEPVTETNRKEALSCLKNIAAEKFAAVRKNSPEFEAFKNWYLGANGLPSTLESFIDNEIERGKQGWYSKPDMAEIPFTAVIFPEEDEENTDNENTNEENTNEENTNEGTITGKNTAEPFTLTGKIDRVMVKDGENGTKSVMVIDYKTGKSTIKEKNKKGYTVQLPLYLKAYADINGMVPEEASYLIVAKNELVDLPFSEKKNSVGEKIEEKIEKCASQIQMMKQGTCIPNAVCEDTHCPFSGLCRKTGAVIEADGEKNE